MFKTISIILCILTPIAFAFTSKRSSITSLLLPKTNPSTLRLNAAEEKSPLLQGLFVASEWMGRLTNLNQSTKPSSLNKSSLSSLSFSQTANKIREEYENIFWATGNMDLSLWEDNCTFSDPFSSFGGKGSSLRFKKNADNLGKFLLSPRLRITSFTSDEASKEVIIGWTFRANLKLPWNPVLAAAGETSHKLSTSTGRIEEYSERWKTDVWEVVKRLFVPGKAAAEKTN